MSAPKLQISGDVAVRDHLHEAQGLVDGTPSHSQQLQARTSSRVLAPWEETSSPSSKRTATQLSAQRLTRLKGVDVLRDPYLNKGTAFTERERDMLGLRGLLAPKVSTIEEQLKRQYTKFNECPSSIAKYHFLASIHNRNETLYYRFLLSYVTETMPIVYTPTVGQACLEFSDSYRARARGLFFSKNDVPHFREMCRNWPQHDVEIIVITDGSRILGLGDLGINGMGIPIGKLALYVAAAGFLPWRTLPITVDLGTNNQKFLDSETYIGLKSQRPNDEEFYSIMDDLIQAIKWRWPDVLIQFEDFSNEHAFGLLDKYRDQTLSFNDDIQGTAATVLAGIIAALRIQPASVLTEGVPEDRNKTTLLRDQRIVFLGAGSAGAGVADLIAAGMEVEGKRAGDNKTIEYYRKNNFWMIDSKGLVTTTRGDKLQDHKVPFARDDPPVGTLLEVIQQAKPTILLGLAGLPGGAFTEQMIKTMDKDCTAAGLRPIVMALSNPTSKAECTAEQCYTWTEGKAIFASGSPFDPVTLPNGKTYHTGQGNNMYIFPGVGYGAVQCKAEKITNTMFYEAARKLALQTKVEDLKKGSVYPELGRIREITANVAAGVCEVAEQEGLTAVARPPNGWLMHLKQAMWWPQYESYL
ncbi:unnamed protein product [Amoebophrya sp. A120]|nr:unnamed protein product [Amoebophrya sp. A120]|eukprot:GSA120T00003171001.1